MKKVLVLTWIVILAFTITNCSKDRDSLDLTIANIKGVWKTSGSSADLFSSFSFDESGFYSLIRSSGDVISGKFSISGDDFITLEDFGSISNTNLTENTFNFKLHDNGTNGSSDNDYNITTTSDGDGGSDATDNSNTTQSLLTTSKWYFYKLYDYDESGEIEEDYADCDNATETWIWFKSDGTVWQDNSPCGDNVGAHQSMTWEYNNNNTELVFTDDDGYAGTWQIIKINSTTLEVFMGDTYPNDDGKIIEYHK